MINRILGLFSYDIGIDLGTANTLVLVKNQGILIREPSVVALHKKTKEVLAIGSEAKEMLGRTPAAISAIRPLKDGVISDFDATQAMLKHYIKKVHNTPTTFPKVPKPRVVIGIPSGVTEVERRAVQEAAFSAGAREAHLIEEPMAAAIGAELLINEPHGIMVVDLGGGTTEIAVISLGGIVVNKSLRIAGDEMTEAIINFLRLKYNVLIGERTAEEIKINIGSAFPNSKTADEQFMVVRGRDIETGLPRSLKISESEIREGLAEVVNQIVEAIADLIEETPPELVADILEKGITLAGGGALLKRLDKHIAERTKMPVWVADDPMTCVVRGCGKVLEKTEFLNKIKITGGLK